MNATPHHGNFETCLLFSFLEITFWLLSAQDSILDAVKQTSQNAVLFFV
jgi:hypothetical protein